MWLSSVCRPPQGLSLSMWVGAGAGIAGQSRNIDIDAGFQGGSGKSMGILYKSATQLEPVKTFFVCILALARTPVACTCLKKFVSAPCRMTVLRVLSVR